MSSNSETKSGPTIHSAGCGIINKLMQYFNQGNSSENLKFPFQNATKCAAAVKGKSEATVCKIK
jgi:hypothetical protein